MQYEKGQVKELHKFIHIRDFVIGANPLVQINEQPGCNLQMEVLRARRSRRGSGEKQNH